MNRTMTRFHYMILLASSLTFVCVLTTTRHTLLRQLGYSVPLVVSVVGILQPQTPFDWSLLGRLCLLLNLYGSMLEYYTGLGEYYWNPFLNSLTLLVGAISLSKGLQGEYTFGSVRFDRSILLATALVRVINTTVMWHAVDDGPFCDCFDGEMMPCTLVEAQNEDIKCSSPVCCYKGGPIAGSVIHLVVCLFLWKMRPCLNDNQVFMDVFSHLYGITTMFFSASMDAYVATACHNEHTGLVLVYVVMASVALFSTEIGLLLEDYWAPPGYMMLH